MKTVWTSYALIIRLSSIRYEQIATGVVQNYANNEKFGLQLLVNALPRCVQGDTGGSREWGSAMPAISGHIQEAWVFLELNTCYLYWVSDRYHRQKSSEGTLGLMH
jgi:hypothetical protein